jgi:amino acid transporter
MSEQSSSLSDVLFGRPLATEEGEGERVGPVAGVPILGLDALASAAYGPEALLTVLLPLGLAGLHYTSILTPLIVCVLLIVFASYRQTLTAYPGGGGAYTVAKENLGTGASLVAAAALMLDYLMNVAVAIAAGVGALVSVVPSLLPHTLSLCLAVLIVLTLINLRGVRATGLAFMAPTYLFVACLFTTIAIGVAKTMAAGGAPEPEVTLPSVASTTTEALSVWLLLRAFSAGCTALTGVEAVSNGVPIFRKPSDVGARRTLAMIVTILTVLILGEAFLCQAYRVTATVAGQAGYQSVLSQLVSAVAGRGTFYHVTLGSVVVVLTLSANTSFADFPRLCRILAGDKYLPEPFVHRGRRLAFSYGIFALSAMSALLLIAFGGITEALIHLFAVGAFLAFTMSQLGMVAHWRRTIAPHARRSLWLNAAGALATGVTLLVVLASKFTEGAWISVLLIGGIIVLLVQVRRHYDFIARATSTSLSLEVGPPKPPIAVLPLRRWDAVTLKALSFAVGFAPEVVAVQVLTGDREVDDLSPSWSELVEEPAKKQGLQPPKLVVLRSEYRQLFAPLLSFVTQLGSDHPDRQIAVVVPELVEPRWYHYLLHNQTASLLKTLLLFRGGPQIVLVSMPWYLQDWLPERRRLLSMRRRNGASLPTSSRNAR